MLITGAVGPLEEMIAHAFAKEGAKVVAAARHEMEGVALTTLLGLQVPFPFLLDYLISLIVANT